MNCIPCLVESGEGSEASWVSLGHPLVDRYLEFVAARGRPNTVLATGYDLKVFCWPQMHQWVGKTCSVWISGSTPAVDNAPRFPYKKVGGSSPPTPQSVTD